jgi:hypothetical protein
MGGDPTFAEVVANGASIPDLSALALNGGDSAGYEVVNKPPRGCAVIQGCGGSSATVQSLDLRLRLAKWAGLVEEQAWALCDLRIRPDRCRVRFSGLAKCDFPDSARALNPENRTNSHRHFL